MKPKSEIMDTLIDVAALLVGVSIVGAIAGLGLLLAGVFSGKC